MEYNLEQFVKDYVNRTQHNSYIIDSIKIGRFQNITTSKYPLSEAQRLEENFDTAYEVTHLLNSFFGVLIVPFESFNSRLVEMIDNTDEANEQLSTEESIRRVKFLLTLRKSAKYQKIAKMISELIKTNRYKHTYVIGDDSSQLDSDDVFFFLKRLRNSLSHGGREGLSFLPIRDLEAGKNQPGQLTHVIFHDELVVKASNKRVRKIAESYIKLSIDEISQLYHLIGELFKEVNQELAFTTEQYKKRVERAEDFFKQGLDMSDSN